METESMTKFVKTEYPYKNFEELNLNDFFRLPDCETGTYLKTGFSCEQYNTYNFDSSEIEHLSGHTLVIPYEAEIYLTRC